MPDKNRFIQEFRSAVTVMLDSQVRVQNLLAMYSIMEWTIQDFENYLKASDITADELLEAIQACEALKEIEGLKSLAKMRP